MSIKIMARVWDLDFKDKATHKLVLLALADAANDEGYCWPSLQTIADKSSISRRHVVTITNDLIEQGYLQKQRRGTTSNMYRVTVAREPQFPSAVGSLGNPSSLPREPQFPTLGNPSSLKPLINRNRTVIKEEEGEFQILLEALVGIPATPNDIPGIRELQELACTEDDIRNALQWRIDNNVGPVKYLSALFPGIKTNRNKRIQQANARPANGNGNKPNAVERYKIRMGITEEVTV